MSAYTCGYCLKSFESRKDLVKHSVKEHPGKPVNIKEDYKETQEKL